MGPGVALDLATEVHRYHVLPFLKALMNYTMLRSHHLQFAIKFEVHRGFLTNITGTVCGLSWAFSQDLSFFFHSNTLYHGNGVSGGSRVPRVRGVSETLKGKETYQCSQFYQITHPSSL